MDWMACFSHGPLTSKLVRLMGMVVMAVIHNIVHNLNVHVSHINCAPFPFHTNILNLLECFFNYEFNCLAPLEPLRTDPKRLLCALSMPLPWHIDHFLLSFPLSFTMAERLRCAPNSISSHLLFYTQLHLFSGLVLQARE